MPERTALSRTSYARVAPPLARPMTQHVHHFRKNNLPMKLASIIPLLAATLLAPATSPRSGRRHPRGAAPPTTPGTVDQRGRTLVNEMIEALGGQAWINRASMQIEGRGSQFFHGEPNPYIIEFHETDRLLAPPSRRSRPALRPSASASSSSVA